MPGSDIPRESLRFPAFGHRIGEFFRAREDSEGSCNYHGMACMRVCEVVAVFSQDR